MQVPSSHWTQEKKKLWPPIWSFPLPAILSLLVRNQRTIEGRGVLCPVLYSKKLIFFLILQHRTQEDSKMTRMSSSNEGRKTTAKKIQQTYPAQKTKMKGARLESNSSLKFPATKHSISQGQYIHKLKLSKCVNWKPVTDLQQRSLILKRPKIH